MSGSNGTITWCRGAAVASLPLVACLLVTALGPQTAWAAPPWGIACGDGRVDVTFDGPWIPCCSADERVIPRPVVRRVPGCHGEATAVDYDLRNVALPTHPNNPTLPNPNAGQSWVVVVQDVPASKQDFSKYTHLRLALEGAKLTSHETVEVKLYDGKKLYTVLLASLTDLPEWRAIYVDLRQFSEEPAIDLTKIERLEIGIKRCTGNECETADNPPGEPTEDHVSTLSIGEFAAVDLRPGASHRLVATDFETVTPQGTIRADAAQALLDQVVPCGIPPSCDPATDLIPTWFPETNRNFNTYAQAEALLTLVSEYERTGQVAFRAAAQNLAAKLIGLQIAPGNLHAGAWYSGRDDALNPPGRSLPKGTTQACDGNETMVVDPPEPDASNRTFVATNLDACEYVGNVGWVLIALGKLRRSGFYGDPAALTDAIDRGAAWLAGQSQFRKSTPGPVPNPHQAYPHLISLGTEGNISAYFGLLAAGRTGEAALLGQAIYDAAWDPTQRRLKPGVGRGDTGTAIDVSGSWGATFLRALGRNQEARDSQAYAASILRVSSFDGAIFGYGDIAGPYTPATEFTAQAAAAGIRDAELVMQQIYPLRTRCAANYGKSYPGAFPGAPDHWYGGTLTPWSTTMCGISPTAWVYFAQNGDPLRDLTVPVLTLSVNQPSFRAGDTLSFTANVTPVPVPVVADVYIALRSPGCGGLACLLFWQGGLSFTATPTPIATNTPVSTFAQPPLGYTFAGTEPAGTYAWLGALTEPGTSTLIRPITETPFTFTP